MNPGRTRTVVILAAGQGKRMRSRTPKALHPLLGRTLLGHVLTAASGLRADRTLVVVGPGAHADRAHLAVIAPDAVPVSQSVPRGTGRAVRTALAAVPDLTGTAVDLLRSQPPLG